MTISYYILRRKTSEPRDRKLDNQTHWESNQYKKFPA